MLKKLLLFSVLVYQISFAQEFSFIKNGTYLSGIPKPDEIIGITPGDRPARYDEVVKYIKAVAEKSPRVKLFESGETHEKRKLYYLVISSEENIRRLDEIENKLNRISDPRITGTDEAEDIASSIPATAWMMYSIHGDELSGTDASVQLVYQLAAGTDSVTMKILNNVITGIDPMQNPDGRERYLAMMQQWTGTMSSSDIQSIQHVGMWPYGRTNHYLFDLNRDWFILAHPETEARVKAITKWKPQLAVDVHEQGAFSTYFFNPPREPLNQHINSSIRKWWKVFAKDQAEAFDDYGWSYYTRETYDDWYPGFGSSLPYFHGAVGILYEQASTDGTPVKRPDGTIVTYRDAVHHQFVSSFANLKTAAQNSKQLLMDYYNGRKNALSSSQVKAYIINPERNRSRTDRLIEKLLTHGIEVEKSEEEFTLSGGKSYLNSEKNKTFPAGSYIIKTSQPLSPLISTLFEFDPRMTTEFLKTERESLEKGKGTQFYEVSAWSILIAYGLDAYSTEDNLNIKTAPLTSVNASSGKVENNFPRYGYLIDYTDDKAVTALLKLFEKNYKVRSAEKEFKISGKKFGRGTLLIRLNENRETIHSDIKSIADSVGIEITGINSALSEDGPDIGGNDFELLEKPKIGLITGAAVNTNSFGSLWYLLDYELKYPHSILSLDFFNQIDLRKYNTLIFPSSSSYKKEFGKEEIEKLKTWMKAGGTIIAVGEASSFFADSSVKLSNVKIRSQALKELESFDEAYKIEQQAFDVSIDSLVIWEGKSPDKNKQDDEEKTEKKFDWAEFAKKEERQKLFMPRGTLMNVELNEEHWLNFGIGKNIPAIVYTSNAYLSKRPVETAARFSKAEELRLSGLLWPEAKERWAKTTYASREKSGSGQLILFAGDPVFRSYFYGTGRMLINAIFLGPGFGADQTVELE